MEHFKKTSDTQTTHRRRRLLLQGTSIGLCLAMGLSMAGCGNKNKNPVKTVAADVVYFSAANLDYYKAAENEQSNLVSVTNCKDKIAMLISVYTYDDRQPILYKDGVGTVAMAASNKDETAMAVSNTAETAAATTSETTAADTAADSSQPAADNTDTTATDETMVITDETQDPNAYVTPTAKYIVLFYDNQGKLISQADLSSSFDANTSVMNMASDKDGNLVILAQSFDQVTYESTFLLFSFDTEGKSIGEPKTLAFEANDYPNQMAIDKAGNMYFTGYGEQGATITVLDSKGNSLYKISGGTENLNGTMYQIGDKMYVDGYEANDKEYKYLFYPLDSAAKKLGEPIDMTSLAGMGGAGFYVGTDGLYYSDSIGVFQINMETKEKTAVLLWKDTDIESNMNGNQKVIILSSDKIMLVSTTYSNISMETKVSLLTREDKNPNAGKKIISIAGVGITYDSNVLSAVYKFNTTNTEYRVELHDYMADQTVNSEADYAKIINTMNMEILSGDGPDIIYGSNQSFSNYEAKGLLVDLYTLMEKDTSFKKADYIPSVFKLCESDGHLYQIGTSFMIQGFAGAKSVIGDRKGWTVDEFNEMVNSLPAGMAPLANQTQSTLLTSSLSASMDAFVDNTKGEVTFDTPEFYQLLDYAKTYGTDDDNKDGEYVDEQTMMQNGELAMTSAYISDPSSYAQYVTMVGGPVSITGFPSSDKRGPMCYMSTMLAISADSGSKQSAWDFVKSFLSEESQNKVADNYQIPVLTSAFEAQITKAMNPDQNGGGNIVYDKMGQMVPMTEETAQAYRDLVNSLDTLASYDQEIVGIVMEEVPVYFNGQKSDKDVAKIIQDRVQTLVNERQ
ncbi:MAG: hypothetical protein WCG21_01890 [Eubacteriales bacterium]